VSGGTAGLVAISYDVSDDRRRQKVAKVLLGFGERVQYSVFECHLTPSRLSELKDRLRGLIDTQHDSVRLYRLCSRCVSRVEVLGQGEVTEDVEFYIV